MERQETMALREAYEKARQYKNLLMWTIIVFAVALILIALFLSLVFTYPANQVSQYGINNATEKANLINQYRTTSIQFIATLAQIIGGGAVLVGLYFAWGNLKVAQATLESNQKKAQKELEVALSNLESDQKNAQRNVEISLATLDSNIKNAQKSLEVSQEGQITERFTRAVDQLGSEKLEIRLGGIYALERIANESDKDCLPIMKILTAYIRANSDANKETLKPGEIREDIQAILTIIGKQKYSFNSEEFTPNLRGTRLCGADLKGAHLERAKLMGVHLEGAHLEGAHLEEAYFTSMARLEKAHLEEAHLKKAHLSFAVLYEAHLEGAHLEGANLVGALLTGANLSKAHLEGAKLEGAKLNSYEETLLGTTFRKPTILRGAHLEGADFHFANLEDADIREAHLEKAKNLKIEQLLKVATLYEVGLDEELRRSLEEKYPNEYCVLNRNPDIRTHKVEDQ
ncbi:pentapeptide repeat-containing protein [Methanosarcina barkeri]|uniref:pentapeptide repeat-containing protein n=1 Tax=Methanosarcina barkeri TaxID=2208 RepID=UPI000695C23E|nr:pentapeptide repeat-containing protein [Methanosarcina barkeri]